jgi:hypothetical protein
MISDYEKYEVTILIFEKKCIIFELLLFISIKTKNTSQLLVVNTLYKSLKTIDKHKCVITCMIDGIVRLIYLLFTFYFNII